MPAYTYHDFAERFSLDTDDVRSLCARRGVRVSDLDAIPDPRENSMVVWVSYGPGDSDFEPLIAVEEDGGGLARR